MPAVELLQGLLRFNTVNPPGDERAAQEWLEGQLREAGFETELLGRTPQRPNLVARLRGEEPGPVLCLLSHVDTVLATPEDWARDPWSGDLVDGEVWGRGAQDMKSQTAAEVAAGIALGSSGWRPPRGDLLVVVVVDEEVGGADGAIWLTRTHPEKVRCDYLLNEGAGTLVEVEGRRTFGVSIAEKGVFRLELATTGVAGHASMPNVADNALPKLVPLLQRLAAAPDVFDLTEAPRALFAELGIDAADPAAALATLRERAPGLAAFVEPMMRVTFAPTQLWASDKINVIPAKARLRVDCRIPPGMDGETALARVKDVLGEPDGWTLEVIEEVVGNASPPDTPLMDALRGWLAREEAGAAVLPTMLPAFTDSRTFRDAFPECVAYGFFPQRRMTLEEMWSLVHAKDERIHEDDVRWAAQCYEDIAKELLA